MKIYTGNGDEGYTRRIDGEAVHKSDPLMAAAGAVDELNSLLGLCVCAAREAEDEESAGMLVEIQNELFTLGVEVMSAGTKLAGGLSAGLTDDSVQRMERRIDEISQSLTPLKKFILPGGCESAGRLHVARSVCRRAERTLAALDEHAKLPPVVQKYVNRLSDLLFVMARHANLRAGLGDVVRNDE